MPLPLAAVWAGVFVPIRPAENVGIAVAVHVHRGDALGVIGAETVRGEDGLRHSVWPVGGSGFLLTRFLRGGGSKNNKTCEKQRCGKGLSHSQCDSVLDETLAQKVREITARLPDPTGVDGHQRLAEFAAKCFSEFARILDDSIYTKLVR